MSFDPTAYDLSNSRIPYDPARTGEYVVAARARDRAFRAAGLGLDRHRGDPELAADAHDRTAAVDLDA